MSFLDLYPSSSKDNISLLEQTTLKRSEVIDQIKSSRSTDILVVGGGIHGSAFARLAAFNGFRVILLEKNDFGNATSSRTSRMAHGGLRYLENLDLKQVWEGIKAREDLYYSAPHLVKKSQFFIPLRHHQRFFKLKIYAGLMLYNLMAGRYSELPEWININKAHRHIRSLVSSDVVGGFIFYDGLMNDIRLVIENVIAARQEGALCLNYARVDHVSRGASDIVTVGWTDMLTGKNYQTKAGVVINCSGPWVASMGRIKPGSLKYSIRYSQGIHLVFNSKWQGPSLLLPLKEHNRYYFVWPHRFGTLVGTTERELHSPPDDPEPTREEIELLLERLNNDLPGSKLNRDTLYYAYAGVRTLPVRKTGKKVEHISRRHAWTYNDGVFSLVGGKFTTANWTVFDGLKTVVSLAGLGNIKISPLNQRRLPGGGLPSSIDDFRQKCREYSLREEIVEQAVARFGSRVRLLMDRKDNFKVIGDSLLAGEVRLAMATEQVETIEDLLKRRLQLIEQPGHGLAIVDEIKEIFKEYKPDVDVEKQIEAYRNKISSLQSLLK
ncbi:MAG: FAD-dependent oxidoreductase [Candidatus Dadabacteria bacterium]|nr:MAG: FAD-dependent oxidoreductase [Candidatus Dadabacteria bacterium]